MGHGVGESNHSVHSIVEARPWHREGASTTLVSGWGKSKGIQIPAHHLPCAIITSFLENGTPRGREINFSLRSLSGDSYKGLELLPVLPSELPARSATVAATTMATATTINCDGHYHGQS